MSKSKSEQPPEPIVLTVSLIESGRFIRAGEPTPYLRVEDVPAHLKEYIATEADPPAWSPRERDFYNNPQPDPGLIYQPLSGERGMRRQAARAASISQEQIYAEEQAQADAALPAETIEALQDSHDLYIGKTKAELEASQRLTDAIYEDAERRVVEPQKFLKRGAVYVSAEKAGRFKPGEHVFVRRESGEYESVGLVDSEGGLPPEEIIP
jgi:hypothetical protein